MRLQFKYLHLYEAQWNVEQNKCRTELNAEAYVFFHNRQAMAKLGN